MKKVAYSVSKRNGVGKLKGIGYLAEDDLFILAFSKEENKPYIKVIEDAGKQCFPNGKDGEFSGTVTELYENVPIHNREKERYETRDCIEVEYSVWYKYVK